LFFLLAVSVKERDRAQQIKRNCHSFDIITEENDRIFTYYLAS